MADGLGHLPRGPRRILLATKWSLQGLRFAWLYESSFRLEVYLLVILGPLGLWLGLGAIPAVSAAQAWVVPVTSAQHLLSGRMSGEAWAQLAVVLVLWGRCLYALGTWRLGRRGEFVLV